MSLTDAENQILYNGARGTVKALAVARLYFAHGGTWSYSGKWGGLLLVADKGAHFLRLLDVNSGRQLWEHELYENALYEAPKEFFHTFEASDSVLGLSYADEGAASEFVRAVWDISRALPAPPSSSGPPGGAPPRPVAPPRAPASSGPSQPSPPTSLTTPPRPAPITPPGHATLRSGGATTAESGGSGIKAPASKPSKSKEEKKKKGWFSKFTESIMGGEDESSGFQLSGPTNFRHESHIGWDPTNGFEIRNIPPEWRKLFQAAGVKKSELRDGQTAKFIMDTVAEATMGMNPTASAGPPPAIPQRPGPPPAPPGGAPGYNNPPPPVPPSPGGPPPPPGPPGPPGPPAPGLPGPPPPPAPGPVGGGGGGLLDGLLTAKLKSNNGPPLGEGGLPDLKNLNEEQGNSLANTLAAAMAARRGAIKEDYDDDELDSDDEWSE